VASARTRVEADTRYWNNLPDAVHIASLKLNPGKHTVSIDFLKENGAAIDELKKTLEIDVPGDGSILVWIRSREQLSSL